MVIWNKIKKGALVALTLGALGTSEASIPKENKPYEGLKAKTNSIENVSSTNFFYTNQFGFYKRVIYEVREDLKDVKESIGPKFKAKAESDIEMVINEENKRLEKYKEKNKDIKSLNEIYMSSYEIKIALPKSYKHSLDENKLKEELLNLIKSQYDSISRYIQQKGMLPFIEGAQANISIVYADVKDVYISMIIDFNSKTRIMK